MVPLLGVRVGGSAVPVTARGAILHSGSALNLLTSKDFLYLGAVRSLIAPLWESVLRVYHFFLFADYMPLVDPGNVTVPNGKYCSLMAKNGLIWCSLCRASPWEGSQERWKLLEVAATFHRFQTLHSRLVLETSL